MRAGPPGDSGPDGGTLGQSDRANVAGTLETPPRLCAANGPGKIVHGGPILPGHRENGAGSGASGQIWGQGRIASRANLREIL
jgi:hypothetical protein